MMGSCDPAEARALSYLVFEVLSRAIVVWNVSFDSCGSLNLRLLFLIEHLVSLITIWVDGGDTSEDREALAIVNVVNLQEFREDWI